MTFKTTTVFHLCCDKCGDYLLNHADVELDYHFKDEEEARKMARKMGWTLGAAKHICDVCNGVRYGVVK